MAKVAVSSQGKEPESQVDPRFGRAAYFLVVDTETRDIVVVDNTQSRNMAHGAGIQAAELVAQAGAKAVLTGVVGPKAWQALEAAGLEIFQDLKGTVADAVDAYAKGQLKSSNSPQGSPHAGGMGGGMGMGGGGGMGPGGGRGRGQGGGGRGGMGGGMGGGRR